MRVLVTAASRHGATAAIAAEVGRGLEENLSTTGAEVDIRTAEQVDSVDEYDAAVVGSAVYLGQWLEPARRVVDSFAQRDQRIPLWLFSSGPIGEPLRPVGDPVDVDDLVARSGAREHVVFGGKLDPRS